MSTSSSVSISSRFPLAAGAVILLARNVAPAIARTEDQEQLFLRDVFEDVPEAIRSTCSNHRGLEPVSEEDVSDEMPAYVDFAALDAYIAMGWGETPRESIPADWRTRRGPDASLDAGLKEKISQCIFAAREERRAAAELMKMQYPLFEGELS